MVHEVARVALAALGPVAKHLDEVEVRIVVATVLARPVEEIDWRQEARGRKKVGGLGG
jgi:hypothetical protein